MSISPTNAINNRLGSLIHSFTPLVHTNKKYQKLPKPLRLPRKGSVQVQVASTPGPLWNVIRAAIDVNCPQQCRNSLRIPRWGGWGGRGKHQGGISRLRNC